MHKNAGNRICYGINKTKWSRLCCVNYLLFQSANIQLSLVTVVFASCVKLSSHVCTTASPFECFSEAFFCVTPLPNDGGVTDCQSLCVEAPIIVFYFVWEKRKDKDKPLRKLVSPTCPWFFSHRIPIIVNKYKMGWDGISPAIRRIWYKNLLNMPSFFLFCFLTHILPQGSLL